MFYCDFKNSPLHFILNESRLSSSQDFSILLFRCVNLLSKNVVSSYIVLSFVEVCMMDSGVEVELEI